MMTKAHVRAVVLMALRRLGRPVSLPELFAAMGGERIPALLASQALASLVEENKVLPEFGGGAVRYYLPGVNTLLLRQCVEMILRTPEFRQTPPAELATRIATMYAAYDGHGPYAQQEAV